MASEVIGYLDLRGIPVFGRVAAFERLAAMVLQQIESQFPKSGGYVHHVTACFCPSIGHPGVYVDVQRDGDQLTLGNGKNRGQPKLFVIVQRGLFWGFQIGLETTNDGESVRVAITRAPKVPDAIVGSAGCVSVLVVVGFLIGSAVREPFNPWYIVPAIFGCFVLFLPICLVFWLLARPVVWVATDWKQVREDEAWLRATLAHVISDEEKELE
jgi:hypothetical protein